MLSKVSCCYKNSLRSHSLVCVCGALPWGSSAGPQSLLSISLPAGLCPLSQMFSHGPASLAEAQGAQGGCPGQAVPSKDHPLLSQSTPSPSAGPRHGHSVTMNSKTKQLFVFFSIPFPLEALKSIILWILFSYFHKHVKTISVSELGQPSHTAGWGGIPAASRGLGHVGCTPGAPC